jgi:putative transposase
MSRKYKFVDNESLYFVTFTVINWIDLFVRNEYRNVIIDSIEYCQKEKDLEVYGWCIMTSHVHMIIGSKGNKLSNIMRDLKRHTSEILHLTIVQNKKESRREWMLWMMEKAAAKSNSSAMFQLWQPESHPIEIRTAKVAHQKLDYLHYNPIEAGFVSRTTDWKYSSAVDYNGGKGLIEITHIDPMII